MPSRRRFLAASAALGVATCFGQSAPDLQAASGGRRVVIVGGGWGGLAAASRLRRLAPALEVVLVEREAEFRSLPLSNAWLVGWRTEPPPRRDLAALAAARGWRLLRAEVTAIDRDRRRVLTAQGELGYDWLVLAAGIDYDYAPWLGDDARAIEATRRLYPAGFVATELDVLRSKLEAFKRRRTADDRAARPGALPASALRARADDRLVAEGARHSRAPDPGRCRRRHGPLQPHVSPTATRTRSAT
jgi:NADPH-dependent 2,4-dienoyl-CoA reductase/sulfur reductase-like enzyme